MSELKLGIVADEIDRDFHTAAKNIKKLGLSRCEIRFLKSGRAPLCDESELREVKRIADGENIEITGFSPGLFKYTTNEATFRNEMNEIFPRAVEWAKQWNLRVLTIFGFAKPNAKDEDGDLFSSDNPPAQIYDWLSEACAQAAENNLELWIEPEPICFADTWKATVLIIKNVNADNLKINYDPSNIAWMNRADNAEEINGAVDLIKNVHVKDQKHAAFGSGFPKWLVVGKGEIDYLRRFEILQSNGYQGVISLEPHFPFDLVKFADCRNTLQEIWETVSRRNS